MNHYIPESTKASTEWRKFGEAIPRFSAGKVLATFFGDCAGVLLVDFLHKRRAVNVAYYCQLRDEVKLTC